MKDRHCTAHSSRTGKPCKRWAIVGGTVCATHGGRAPQVAESAKERLAALVDPAITTLHDLLASTRDDVRLGAAKDVLDRNGFKPTEKIDVNANVSLSRLSDQELEARLAELEAAERAALRTARGTQTA